MWIVSLYLIFSCLPWLVLLVRAFQYLKPLLSTNDRNCSPNLFLCFKMQQNGLLVCIKPSWWPGLQDCNYNQSLYRLMVLFALMCQVWLLPRTAEASSQKPQSFLTSTYLDVSLTCPWLWCIFLSHRIHVTQVWNLFDLNSLPLPRPSFYPVEMFPHRCVYIVFFNQISYLGFLLKVYRQHVVCGPIFHFVFHINLKYAQYQQLWHQLANLCCCLSKDTIFKPSYSS